jgi:hypothetical protein
MCFFEFPSINTEFRIESRRNKKDIRAKQIVIIIQFTVGSYKYLYSFWWCVYFTLIVDDKCIVIKTFFVLLLHLEMRKLFIVRDVLEKMDQETNVFWPSQICFIIFTHFFCKVKCIPGLSSSKYSLFVEWLFTKNWKNWSHLAQSGATYSSGQKFLNDHSIWHNFFVSQPIDLIWSKLHITIVYFLAKNWKVWCFLAEVMILRMSVSKSKVDNSNVQFWPKFQINRLRNKKNLAATVCQYAPCKNVRTRWNTNLAEVFSELSSIFPGIFLLFKKIEIKLPISWKC